MSTLLTGTQLGSGGGSGVDEKTKVSSNDTTPDFLEEKTAAGTNITLTTLNDGGDEQLEISAPDVAVGAASSTDNAVARFDGTTGKTIQNSGVTIDDSGNIATSGTVDGRDVSVDGAKLDTVSTNADVTLDVITNGVEALTTAEVDQLENIGTTTISTTQWGYVGELDQSLTTNSDVDFNTATLSNSGASSTLDLTNAGAGTTLNINNGGSGDFIVVDTNKMVLDNSGNLSVAGTIDTGQGATELYAMNQNVRTTDDVTFATISSTDGISVDGDGAGGSNRKLYFGSDTDTGIYQASAWSDRMAVLVGNSFAMDFDHSGVQNTTTVNSLGADIDFIVEGDTDPDLIHTEASTDRVGVGTATPSEKLDVVGNIAVSGTVDGRDVATDGSTLDTINANYITASSTTTLTNKTFDANGTGNSISNIDVTDLANGTDGELITWDATGAPTTVAAGTSGQVLTSNGAGAAPTFQDATGGGGGAVVQVVENSVTDVGIFTTTSTSWVDVPSHTVTITPTSASNRVKVTFYTTFYATATTSQTYPAVRVLRGASTEVHELRRIAILPASSGTIYGCVAFSFIDSPATTSPTTYKLQVQNSAGASTIAMPISSSSASSKPEICTIAEEIV